MADKFIAMAELGDDPFIIQRRRDAGAIDAGSEERVADAYFAIFCAFFDARGDGPCGAFLDIGEYYTSNSGYFAAVDDAVNLFILGGRIPLYMQ